MLAVWRVVAENGAEGGEEAAHELQILPATDELIWGTIAFLLLAFFMIKVVFPKLRAGLDARAAAIQGQIEQAERTRREADEVLEQYRAQVAGAREEVARIIEEGKRTAEAMRKDLIAKAESEAAEIVNRARTEVSGERDRAMAELRTTLGDLSLQLASRVIEKDLTSVESHRALVDRAIEELARSNGSN